MNKLLSKRFFIHLLLLFIIYVATGILGLRLQAVNTFATFIWLPTGIAVTAVLLGGYRLWPAILLGAFFVNLSVGAPFFVAIGIAIGNTLEPLIDCLLLQYLGFHTNLERNRDLLGLTLFAIPIGGAISATCGIASLWLGNVLSPETFLTTWTAWWFGNLLSGYIVVPFLLLWFIPLRLTRPSRRRLLESIAVILFLLLSCLFLFTDSFFMTSPTAHRTYIIFPPLIWIALRFGQRATITALVLISLAAIITTLNGLGPFVGSDIAISFLYLQVFMGTITLTSMILATIINEYRQIEKRKDEFIGIASHELKTPLTSIGMFLQLLKRMEQKKKGTQSAEIIEKTERQVKNMTKLIADLLDLSKMQVGRLELHKERFSIDDLIHTTVDSLKRISPTHRILVEGQTKKRMYADKERITQVLINLITNAIKYSPEADKVVVSLYATKLQVTVSVQDFGIGITPSNQEKIFERFFRVKDPTQIHYPGFGLGLSISKEIITKHHGRLFVKSTRGKGSTFFFSLPLLSRNIMIK